MMTLSLLDVGDVLPDGLGGEDLVTLKQAPVGVGIGKSALLSRFCMIRETLSRERHDRRAVQQPLAVRAHQCELIHEAVVLHRGAVRDGRGPHQFHGDEELVNVSIFAKDLIQTRRATGANIGHAFREA